MHRFGLSVGRGWLIELFLADCFRIRAETPSRVTGHATQDPTHQTGQLRPRVQVVPVFCNIWTDSGESVKLITAIAACRFDSYSRWLVRLVGSLMRTVIIMSECEGERNGQPAFGETYNENGSY
jgi:hypothetical protein